MLSEREYTNSSSIQQALLLYNPELKQSSKKNVTILAKKEDTTNEILAYNNASILVFWCCF